MKSLDPKTLGSDDESAFHPPRCQNSRAHIKIAYSHELIQYPKLADGMFRHRAIQFHDRLDWAVHVDEHGHEKDQYDALDPLYVICTDDTETHRGSIRLMPTIGKTLLNDHFSHLTGGVQVRNPLTWECTRLCLAPDAAPDICQRIFLEILRLGLRKELQHYAAIFDERMERVYRRLGWSPDVIGQEKAGDSWLKVGLWRIEESVLPNLSRGIVDDSLSWSPKGLNKEE